MTVRRTRWPLALLLVVLVSPTLPRATAPQLLERFIDGYHGPYRGRVIDVDTKAPLPGAAVVAVWRREIVYPLHSSTIVYRVMEVLTDTDGTFVIHAKDLEERAPRHTLHPSFVVFLPGFTVFQGIPERGFQGAGTTVALRRLKSWAERREVGQNVYPHELSEAPFSELPQLMRLVNEDRVARGLKPYSRPQEK